MHTYNNYIPIAYEQNSKFKKKFKRLIELILTDLFSLQ